MATDAGRTTWGDSPRAVRGRQRGLIAPLTRAIRRTLPGCELGTSPRPTTGSGPVFRAGCCDQPLTTLRRPPCALDPGLPLVVLLSEEFGLADRSGHRRIPVQQTRPCCLEHRRRSGLRYISSVIVASMLLLQSPDRDQMAETTEGRCVPSGPRGREAYDCPRQQSTECAWSSWFKADPH